MDVAGLRLSLRGLRGRPRDGLGQLAQSIPDRFGGSFRCGIHAGQQEGGHQGKDEHQDAKGQEIAPQYRPPHQKNGEQTVQGNEDVAWKRQPEIDLKQRTRRHQHQGEQTAGGENHQANQRSGKQGKQNAG